MRLSILADTNIGKAIVVQLRANGMDAIRLEEIADLANNATDSEILDYATKQERSVLSLDDDFRTLHFNYLVQQKNHAGIILAHKSLQGKASYGRIVNAVLEYSELIETEDDIRSKFYEINPE
jgi:predicted nuclease of predicted toxin-antitoxin system